MMLPRRPLTRSLLLSLTMAATVPTHAIGVGDIDILSHLNQPLLARIRILAEKNEGIRPGDLEVRVASRAHHARYGLDYPPALKSARFVVTPQGDGSFMVRATTSRPLKEPLLNFLLEVDWGKGKLYKEVALLLDPPGYQRLPVTAARNEPAPLPAKPPEMTPIHAVIDDAERYQPPFTHPAPVATSAAPLADDVFVLTPEDLAPPPAVTKPTRKARPKRKVARARTRPTAAPALKDGRYGPVRAGDTLSKIARRIAGPGADKATVRALMEAIYAANPQAFAGSMDALEKNSYLTIPSQEEIALGPSYLETASAIGISDFVTTVDGDSDIVITEEVTAEATPSPAPEGAEDTPPGQHETAEEDTAVTLAETASGELRILPPDQAAAEISRRMSARMAELDQAARHTPPPAPAPTETVDNDPAVADAANATTTVTSDQRSGSGNERPPGIAALEAEIASLKSERNELLDRLATTESKLEETETTLQRLELKIEALTNALGQRGDDNGFSAFIARWLPWLLLLPLLPLLAFLVWRRRRAEAVEEIPAPVTPVMARTSDPMPAPATIPEDDIETVESASRGIDLDLIEAEAAKAATPAADRPDSTLSMDPPESKAPDDLQAMAAPPMSPSDTGTLDQDLESLLSPAAAELGHAPAASDTQETMRPAPGDDDATQILSGGNADDTQLDAAEEAEIYLAYGQFSLAEETIDKLLAQEPDNDRYRLLQLKLFAETGRMNELQSLSVQLLEKYPDPDSGMHKQVRNISDRAFTKKALRDETLADQHEAEAPAVANTDDGITGNAADRTLDELSMDADKLSATYTDDIVDYMSEETLPDLDLLDLEDSNAQKTVFEDPLQQTSETAPSLELEEEDLTESDLDSLTVDMELNEAKLEIDNGSDDRTVVEDHIEEFSDTDLRLEPIDLEGSGQPEDSLDISFDLEAELKKHVTKVNPDDKAS